MPTAPTPPSRQPEVVAVVTLPPASRQPVVAPRHDTEAQDCAEVMHSDAESNSSAQVVAVVALTIAEAVDLTGRSRQAILKAIQSGRLHAEPNVSQSGPNKGRTEYSITPAALLTVYPDARAAWERQRAKAQTHQVATRPTQHPVKRDPQQVILRANPDALQRAQAIQQARLSFLDLAIRPRLACLNQWERRSARGGVPFFVLGEAQQWLRTTPEGQAILRILKSAPSDNTLRRWWGLYADDPSGDALKPHYSACGRPRRTDETPALESEIRGAYAHTGSFVGAADLLRQKGYAISEATVRRRLQELDPAILIGLRMGTRKAITDHGPYVRRRPSLPFQCWSIDGHKLDALVLWDDPLPGETLEPFRPDLYVVRDVGSGAILACQIGHGLNRYLPLMAVAEALLRFGVVPDSIQPDNGSEVCNGLFDGDADVVGYWAQLGMEWKDGQALVRHALPYNSRSKPVERDFRTLTEGFSARLPAYVGGNPSARPGAPLAAAKAAGNYETVASLKARLNAWLGEKIQTERTVQRRRITPALALQEMKNRLIQELGADHPRFLRPGQEWRVLPGLKARLIRSFVCCRIEGQELRFHTPILDGLDVDGLTVRINPWDITQAWLCRGGELVDVLTFVPDGPELGAGSTDVVALRIAKNIERRQKGILKQAEILQERNRVEAGMLAGHRAKALPIDEPLEIKELTSQQMEAAAEMRAQMGIALPSAQTTPAAASAGPAERRHIKTDFDWALFVIQHPEHSDAEEIQELNTRLRTDSNLRLWLQKELGEVPNQLPFQKEA